MSFVRTHREFRDFQELEEFQRSLNLTQQPMGIAQLERGQPLISSSQVELDGLQLASFEMSHRVKFETQLKPCESVLVLKQHRAMHCTWNGLPFPSWGAALMRGGHTYDVVHESGFASLEITLPESVLTESGLTEPEADPAQIALSEAEARLHARRLHLLLADDGLGSRSPSAARELVLSTCESVMSRLDAAAHPKIPMGLARSRVTRAERIIAGNLENPLDLPWLARSIGVSTCTLRREFVQVMGIPPKAYLLARRLEAAKRALRRGTSTVADVSDRYGFSHPSRFAEHYKRHFGERPSVTVRSLPPAERASA